MVHFSTKCRPTGAAGGMARDRSAHCSREAPGTSSVDDIAIFPPAITKPSPRDQIGRCFACPQAETTKFHVALLGSRVWGRHRRGPPVCAESQLQGPVFNHQLSVSPTRHYFGFTAGYNFLRHKFRKGLKIGGTTCLLHKVSMSSQQ